MSEQMIAIQQAADYLKTRLQDRQPVVGIVLGSGLGRLAEEIQHPIVIPYADIPNFVKSFSA